MKKSLGSAGCNSRIPCMLFFVLQLIQFIPSFPRSINPSPRKERFLFILFFLLRFVPPWKYNLKKMKMKTRKKERRTRNAKRNRKHKSMLEMGTVSSRRVLLPWLVVTDPTHITERIQWSEIMPAWCRHDVGWCHMMSAGLSIPRMGFVMFRSLFPRLLVLSFPCRWYFVALNRQNAYNSRRSCAICLKSGSLLMPSNDSVSLVAIVMALPSSRLPFSIIW